MTPAERAATVERILRPAFTVLADPASDPPAVARARDALREVTRLLDAIHASREDNSRLPETSPRPHDAREAEKSEREAAGLHPLRKGRDQCTGHRRDGARCEAPAIEGGLVFRRHGGAAPQVAIAAEYREKKLAALDADAAFTEARGTRASSTPCAARCAAMRNSTSTRRSSGASASCRPK